MADDRLNEILGRTDWRFGVPHMDPEDVQWLLGEVGRLRRALNNIAHIGVEVETDHGVEVVDYNPIALAQKALIGDDG